MEDNDNDVLNDRMPMMERPSREPGEFSSSSHSKSTKTPPHLMGSKQILGIPSWMQADKESTNQRIEIILYKFVTNIPVMITFGVYIFLNIFYIFVSFFTKF